MFTRIEGIYSRIQSVIVYRFELNNMTMKNIYLNYENTVA